MIELSYDQVEFLKSEISKAGITYSHLEEDLIDHVCCDVEEVMQIGLPFEKAFEQVKLKFGTDGLLRIQQDTLYLIDKNYRIMKNLMKLSGLIAPVLLAFGALFKIQHLPGSGIVLVAGFFVLSFLFLPSAIYVSYKEVSKGAGKWMHIAGFLGSFLLSVSFLFKIMHWPAAGVVMLAGDFLLCLMFLPMLMIRNLRNTQLPKYLIITIFISFIMYTMGFLFKLMHWPGAAILLLISIVLAILVVFPTYTIKVYGNETHIKNSFIFKVIVIIWIIIPTMLLSINSGNYNKAIITNAQSLKNDRLYFEASNRQISEKLKGNPLAQRIVNQADSLNLYIQSLKLEMLATLANNEISGKNEDYEHHAYTVFVDDPALLPGSDVWNKLNVKMASYKSILDSTGVTYNPYLELKTFQKPGLLAISYTNELSMLQLEILKAEYWALQIFAGKDKPLFASGK